MSPRGARRFVADLLDGRRPRSFRAQDTDVDELRAAIMLRAPGRAVGWLGMGIVDAQVAALGEVADDVWARWT